MKLDQRLEIANDNAPEPLAVLDLAQVNKRFADPTNRGSFHELAALNPTFSHPHNSGFRSGFLASNRRMKDPALHSETFNAGFETVTLSGLIISLFAFVAALYAFPSLILGAAFAVITFSFLVLARVKQGWRARELTALAAWLAVSSVGIAAFTTMSGMALLAGFAGLSISYMTKTRLSAVLGSLALLSLAWVFSPFFMSSETLTATQAALLTAALFGYLGLAGRLSSRSVLGLAFTSLTVWSAVWLSTSGLSMKAISVFVFICSVALYKLGKAALDEDAFGALVFICYGWITGFTAFLFLQHSYLSPEAHILSGVGKSAAGSMAWAVGVCCALACIFASGLSRHKHNRQNFISLFLSTLALGSVPFIIFRPGSLEHLLDTTPGLSAIPTIGLVLASFGFSVALIMILNGLRLRRNLYLFLGLAALGAQFVLVFNPSLFTLDNVVIFMVSLLCAASLISFTTPSKA